MCLDVDTKFYISLGINSCEDSSLRASVYLYNELVRGNDFFPNLLTKMTTNEKHFLPGRGGGKLKQGAEKGGEKDFLHK